MVMPEQTREFTDERFENLVVTNDGSPRFVVHELSPRGQYEPIDEFTAVEVSGREGVSEMFARRRAALYFATLAKGGPRPEAEPEEGGGVATASAVPPSRLKLGAPKAKPPVSKGVDPLAGMRQMTPGDVDTVISGARGERDPAKAKALRQQALSMMAQESKRRGESRAQCWVRHLLS